MRTRIQGTKEETCWSETSENGESSPSPDICGSLMKGSSSLTLVGTSVLNDATHCEITQISSAPDNHAKEAKELNTTGEGDGKAMEKNFRFHHKNPKLSPAEEELFNLIGDSSMGMATQCSSSSDNETERGEMRKENQELSSSPNVQDGNDAKNYKSEIERMNESLNHMPMDGENGENGKSGMDAHQDTLSLIDLIESNIQLCDIDIQELAEIPNEPTLIEESLNEDIELDMFIDNVIPMIVNEMSEGDEETTKSSKAMMENSPNEMMTLNCVNFISSETHPNGLIIMPETCLIQFALIPPTVSLIQQVHSDSLPINTKFQMVKSSQSSSEEIGQLKILKIKEEPTENKTNKNSNVELTRKGVIVSPCDNTRETHAIPNDSSEDESGISNSLYSAMKDDPKRFRCELCFSTFTDFSLLLHHLNCHSGKKDDFKYTCKVCPTRFQSQRDVKMHFDYKHSDPSGVSTRYRSNRADLKPLFFKKFHIRKDFKTVIEDTKLFGQGKTNGASKLDKASIPKPLIIESPKRQRKEASNSKEKPSLVKIDPEEKSNPNGPVGNEIPRVVENVKIVKEEKEEKIKILPPSVQPPASNSKMNTRSQNARIETQVISKGFTIVKPQMTNSVVSNQKNTKETVKIPDIKRKVNPNVIGGKEELFKSQAQTQQRRKPAILSHPTIKHSSVSLANKPTAEVQATNNLENKASDESNKRKNANKPLTCDCKKEFPNKKRLDSHKRSIKKCTEPDPKEKKAIAEESQKEMENILRIIMREREKAEAEGIPIYNGKKTMKKGPDFNTSSVESSAKIKCGCGTRTRSKEELKRKRKELSPPPTSSKKLAKSNAGDSNKTNKSTANNTNNNNHNTPAQNNSNKRRNGNCSSTNINDTFSNSTAVSATNKNPPKPPPRRSKQDCVRKNPSNVEKGGKSNNVSNYSMITTTTTISSSTDLPIKFIFETKNNFSRKDDKENNEDEEEEELKDESEERGMQMMEDDTDSDEDDEYEDEDEYGEFKCFQCGIIFDSEVYYNRHFQHVHSQKLACGYCNKEYECKYLLRIHINEVHVESEIESGRLANFECPHCGKKIKFIKNYELHMNWHERRFASKMQDAPFKCHVCGVIVKSREFYPEHFKSKTHQDFLKVYNKGD